VGVFPHIVVRLRPLANSVREVAMSGLLSSLGRVAPWTLGGTARAQAAPSGQDANTQARESQEQAVVDVVSVAALPLDIASYGAIAASVKSSGAIPPYGFARGAPLEDAMAMIGHTLSQGQGGYYIAINAPGASLATAMTPGQLSGYMQSGGTLYQDTLASSDGHTYSIYGLLQQAFAANARTEQRQAIGACVDPRLSVAEALLDQLRADSEPAGSARALLFGAKSGGPDTAKVIRTIVLQTGSQGPNGVRLTVVYFPPTNRFTTSAPAPATPETLQLAG
jgi:hypothetical protein